MFDTQLWAPPNASLQDTLYGAPRMLFEKQNCSLLCFWWQNHNIQKQTTL